MKQEKKYWWEFDEELDQISKKYDKGGCCCQCEGVHESVYYICALHPPEDIQEMRAIIKYAMKEAARQEREKIFDGLETFVKKCKKSE